MEEIERESEEMERATREREREETEREKEREREGMERATRERKGSRKEVVVVVDVFPEVLSRVRLPSLLRSKQPAIFGETFLWLQFHCGRDESKAACWER